jgi:bifunctional oligoribonuclease and PAP phosphatase NrnA
MIQRIIEEINKNHTFLITAHVRLDGDALGSELTLYHLLTNMGKMAVIYNQDPTPGNYRFLPGADQITHAVGSVEHYDAVFIVDCSDLDRIGEEAARIGAIKQIINIDHHISNNGFSTVSLIEPQASSTGELIFRLVSQMGAELTREMATSLYTAILTDTGGFRYGNTTKDALITAGHLAERGADPQWISQNVYENNPHAKIRLLTKVLQSLSFDENGTVGSIVVLLTDLQETGALQEHTEGFVDLPRTVSGTAISILYSEIAEKRFKISLRSKNHVDVERVARAFGGGGHINAAACRIEGDIETVKRRMLAEIRAGQAL